MNALLEIATEVAATLPPFGPGADLPNTESDAARRAAWLEERRTCITGTELAAIFGLSPWLRPIDVYADKMGFRDPFEPNDAMRAGKRFERAILEETAERAGRVLNFADPYKLIRVPGFDLLGATLDSTWADTGVPVDAKNIRFRTDDWGEAGSSEFPQYYQLQLHDQAMATKKERAELAVCFTGQDFSRYTLFHDEELDDVIKEEVTNWWNRHIVANVAPEPDGSASFTTYLKSRFKRATDVQIEPTPALEETVQNLKMLKADQDDQDKAIAELEQHLKRAIGNAQGIRGLCTWKNNKDSAKTNWKAAFEDLRDFVLDPKRWTITPQYGIPSPEIVVPHSIDCNTHPTPGARVLRLSK